MDTADAFHARIEALFAWCLQPDYLEYLAAPADEMSERRDFYFKSRRDVYAEWLRLLEETTRGSDEGRIAVADWQKTLANRQKNGAGQLDGDPMKLDSVVRLYNEGKHWIDLRTGLVDEGTPSIPAVVLAGLPMSPEVRRQE